MFGSTDLDVDLWRTEIGSFNRIKESFNSDIISKDSWMYFGYVLNLVDILHCLLDECFNFLNHVPDFLLDFFKKPLTSNYYFISPLNLSGIKLLMVVS